MGEGGFKINNMSHVPAVSLPCGHAVWNGSIDLAFSPYVVLGDSVLDQLRMGVHFTHNQGQKAAHDVQGNALLADFACMHPECCPCSYRFRMGQCIQYNGPLPGQYGLAAKPPDSALSGERAHLDCHKEAYPKSPWLDIPNLTPNVLMECLLGAVTSHSSWPKAIMHFAIAFWH